MQGGFLPKKCGVVSATEERPLANECDLREAEIAQLREALWSEWEANHTEHCGRDWPHAAGQPCYWEPPRVLLRGSQ